MDKSDIHQSKSVDLTRFKLEKHVDQSFRTAWALAEGQPINARHSLLSALILRRRITSQAFSMLASLLPLSGLDSYATEHTSTTELEAIQFNSHLSAAWSVAEPFLLENKGSVWGRDYVTWVLLADNDPSLHELIKEAGSNLKTIQDNWYRFVISDSTHRGPESWSRWWRSAGVPLPDERVQDSEIKAAGRIDTEHNTYLLTWTPARFPFSNFAKNARQVMKKGESIMTWSTGKRTHLSIGDRVFLMRHGKDRPGVVGSGHFASQVYKGPHWERDKADIEIVVGPR